MKIAIVGCGAMGCIYAAMFCEAGHEVWAIDTWRAHVDAINGMVPVVAQRTGTEAPYNLVMAAAVRAREARFS